NVIVIEMITDEKGSYYAPKDITAKPGDVLRFTLVTGVHNANFVADSNKGVAGLPAASDLLQLPGQTYDFTVPNAKDDTKLFFQCDPHALLGMVGTIEIDLD
ncbi:MAG: plastocyanin/azurin family copper-binding protein, partial [Gemmatimonadales bacterium]